MKNSIKIFKAFSDETRLRIFNLLLLTESELNGKTIAAILHIPQYAVSRHILILINSGLLKKRRETQNIFFSISSLTKKKREDFLKFFDSLFQDSAKFRVDFQKFSEITEIGGEMTSDKMKKTGNQQPVFRFNNDAAEYDFFIEKVIPYYNLLISELIKSIPFDTGKKINALDVGIGTGKVTEKFIEKYEYASITGLDISEEMIKMASKKFSKKPIPFRFLIQKIEDLSLNEKYDCIYSCLTLHHIENDDRKAECYKKIFNSLEPEGVFVNGDVVAGKDEKENELYGQNLRDFLKNNLQSEEEVENWMNRHLENDFPAPLSMHTKWLKDAGFKEVKIFWKKMNYTVFGGIKG